jgi:aspartyl-tRNA(Asn)/glutamyl-tRNA(Gln) amidotransferase subunit B
MRSKEEAHDYRYFPEPDLLDFLVEEEFIEKEKPFVKELPHDRHKRFLDTYKLQESDTDVLISEKFIADYFEEAVKEFNEPKKICNFIIGPFLEQVNTFPDRFQSVKLSAQNFSKIVKYFSTGLLNNLAAKKVLVLSINNNNDVDEIIKKEGLSQVSNESELKGLVEEAIKENQKAVQEYMDGKEQAIMFLVGSVMKKTKGKANPKVAKELLEKVLKR